MFLYIFFLIISYICRSSPYTSPQRAQHASHQAEREQHTIGSPPSRRQPHSLGVVPSEIPAALKVC